MHYLELTALLAVMGNLILTSFVFFKDPRAPLNRVYILWGMAVTIWNLSSYFLFRKTTETAGMWVHLLQVGVIALPALNFHICLILAHKVKRIFLLLVYAATAILYILLATGRFIAPDPIELQFAYYSQARFGFFVYIFFYIILAVYSLVILQGKQPKASQAHRTRLRWMTAALLLLIICGTNDLLPILGVMQYPFTSRQIYPVGNTAAIFYVIIVGYSVLQHQLLDVHIALGRLAAQMTRFLFMFLAGFVMLLIISQIVPQYYNQVSFLGSLAVLMASSLLASKFFPKLFGVGSEVIERRILGDYFEYQDRITAFIQSVPWYADHNDLFSDLEVLMKQTIGTDLFRIILRDHLGDSFVVFRGDVDFVDKELNNFTSDSHLFTLLKNSDTDFLILKSVRPSDLSKIRQELAGELKAEDAELCFPCYSDGELFGFIFLGSKKSGDPYTKSDAEALTRLFKSLTLVINQIRLKEQIKMEQELDLLGRMSRGLAHDLNNLLTPVWTLLQVSQSAPSADPEMDDLVQTAAQNIHTMRNYIRDSLFFSKTMKPQMAQAKIGDLVLATIHMLQSNLREKSMTVRFQPGQSIEGILDVVLFQRLLANLLSNAIDASAERSAVAVEVESIPRRDSDRNWLRLRVIDQGEGISPATLERMKAAFFTTKDSGDGKRGFGLGLAICRKIVHLHGGTLNISSQRGKGTTVQVDLPNGTIPAVMREMDLAHAL